MTFSLRAISPLGAPVLAVLTTLGTAAAVPQERDWVVLPLPTEDDDAASRGPAPLLDGQHVHLVDSLPNVEPDLGPLLTTRGAEEIVWRAVQAAADGGGTVEPLGDAVLVRGPLEARQAGAAALRALQADLDALRFDVRARLVATAPDGSDETVVFDDVRRVRSGGQAAFGRRAETSFVADYDVEVANEMAIADPVIGRALTGETVHVWASSFVDGQGRRRVFVQGLLDVAKLVEMRRFDPDVFELGAIDQPVVAATQVLFSGALPADGPLVVRIAGLDGDRSSRTLEVALAPREGVGDAPTIVDLGRGLWRERIRSPHLLIGRKDGLAPVGGPTPTSLTQLYYSSFRRERGDRPVQAESLLVVGDGQVATELRELAAQLDPLESGRRLLVSAGGIAVDAPVAAGALARVTHTRETAYVVDYDPQVASTAALSDPNSTWTSDGWVVEGVSRQTAFVGRGVVEAVDVDETRDATPSDVGRIQLPVRTRVPFPLRLQPEDSTRPIEGLDVRWTSEGGADSGR